jgi:hypothetical protein
MKIGILGSGMVGESIGTRLVQLGHQVRMGSRTDNNERAAAWVRKNGTTASQGTFRDTAKFGEILFNCTAGLGSLDALRQAEEADLNGKILIDISNPLDFSKGMPPTLTVCNTDSLGEQIQQAFPRLMVVKTLNTVNCVVMVNPAAVGKGDHDMFVCGNDTGAKGKVTNILKDWFGWKRVIDLGDITNARGTEMWLPLWIRLMVSEGTPMFNLKIVK